MALLDKIEKELMKQQQRFVDSVYEPSEETLRFNAVLESLGFDHGGEFYAPEYSVDDYEFTEIGKCAIATSDNHILVLNYSIMEFWESFNNIVEPRLFEIAVEAVKKLEGVAS